MTRSPIRGALIALAVVLGLVVVYQVARNAARRPGATPGTASSKTATTYQCPMHPQIVQDHPGQCPICGMELQLIGQATEAPSARRSDTPLYYRHPMNPAITSPVPAKDDMGMPFIPVYEEAGSPAVEGRGSITVPLYKQQLIGVTLGTVERRPLTRTIYTTGRIAYDPGLYQAQVEYLSALRARELATRSPIPGAEERAAALLEASRTRLHLLGLSQEQIAGLAEAGAPDATLLLAPADGRVWMYADVYEQELPLLQAGQTVEAALPGQPGRRFTGTIVAIDPNLDMRTRSAKIRAELTSAEGLLRPGMYVNATIHAELGERLVVPRSAILDTGKRRIAFVAGGEGRFDPREVQLGLRGTEAIEVLGGLAEGEQVVASGNFLLDAESQLQGAAGGGAFYGGQEAAEGAPGGHQH